MVDKKEIIKLIESMDIQSFRMSRDVIEERDDGGWKEFKPSQSVDIYITGSFKK